MKSFVRETTVYIARSLLWEKQPFKCKVYQVKRESAFQVRSLPWIACHVHHLLPIGGGLGATLVGCSSFNRWLMKMAFGSRCNEAAKGAKDLSFMLPKYLIEIN